MTAKSLKLDNKQLAILFNQLHRLESSGLPASQAFSLLKHSDARLNAALQTMRQLVQSGHSIAEAGHKSGVFDLTQSKIISASEAGGCLATVYQRLALRYQELDKHSKIIKSRLTMPVFVLVLATFIQPLPALVTSGIDITNYIALTFGKLTIIGLSVYALVNIPEIVGHLGIEKSWHRLQLRLTPMAKWVIRRQLNEFLFILGLLLQSGTAFAQALPISISTIKNTVLRDSFKPATSHLKTGDSVTATLSNASIISPDILQIINSGEQSGRLAESLLHYVKLESEDIALQDRAFAEWLPRLVYAAVACWMAYGILSHGIMPIVPSDL